LFGEGQADNAADDDSRGVEDGSDHAEESSTWRNEFKVQICTAILERVLKPLLAMGGF